MPQLLHALLTKQPTQPAKLSRVLAKVAQLAQLQASVEKYLDSNVRPHCQVANFEQGTLVLMVDSAAWATRLRYTLPELRDQLRSKEGLAELGLIRLIVRQPESTPRKKPGPKLCLSSDTGTLLAQTAESIDHKPLSDALARLAKHVNKKT